MDSILPTSYTDSNKVSIALEYVDCSHYYIVMSGRDCKPPLVLETVDPAPVGRAPFEAAGLSAAASWISSVTIVQAVDESNAQTRRE